jgi:lysophospholipase L1-like esterase
MKTLLFLILLIGFSATFKAQTSISPNNQKIKFTGAKFNDITNERIIFYRHSQEFYNLPDNVSLANDTKAKTTSGVTINFKTGAENIKVHFKMLEGANEYWIRTSYYIDGDSIATAKVKRDDLTNSGDSSFYVEIVPVSKSVHEIKVVLPTLSSLGFYGISLEGGNEFLEDFDLPEKPLYVAYGNSITHGRGQNTGDQTYAWILADNMSWELYNIAVGGSKTSVPMAQMISNEIPDVIDFMTILIGYNDAVSYAQDTNYYHKKLVSFIDTVRSGHPETTIFVLGQTYTLTTENGDGEPIDFNDWRKIQQFVVDSLTAAGDTLIHYINGADYTDYNDLNNPPQDAVHLSINGANNFGIALADTISKILDSHTGILNRHNLKNKLTIYPNPSSDKIIVKISKENINTVKLFDINGKILSVPVYFLTNRIVELSINELKKGTYIVYVNGIGEPFIKN